MDTQGLPLFLSSSSSHTPIPKTVGENVIQPLSETLYSPTNTIKQTETIKKSLDDIFPEQQYEDKGIKKGKEILGGLVNKLSSVQLRDMVSEIQYLTESWLDDFERETFKGKTLKEMLHEKGGL